MAESPRDGYFYGLEIMETNVIFLVDCSRSMRGEKIEHLRKEVNAALAGMSATNRFVVIPFGGYDPAMFPPRGLTVLSSLQRGRAAKYMARQRAAGKTPMLQAIKSTFPRVINRAAAAGLRVDAIYLLSDGEASDAKPEKLLEEVDRINRKTRVRIHTISMGQASQLLQDLAVRNEGRHRTVSIGSDAGRNDD